MGTQVESLAGAVVMEVEEQVTTTVTPPVVDWATTVAPVSRKTTHMSACA
ncbi:hypothetical protein H5399_09145 [Tessaracoccus sp. MC1627]|nr:hypothetical protein [Tessaracoccus sp. MC1627]MBB1512766.1 hypothetical protein [Tessaracoccus sp. MC1627]